MTLRDEFKERLINDLHSRIGRIEQRQRRCAVLLILSVVVGAALLIRHYLPMLDVVKPALDAAMPTIATSPTYILLICLLFVIIFIASYLIDNMKMCELKRQLQTLKQ